MNVITSTAVIQKDIKIKRERLLPQLGNVIARVGQEVSPVQVVARGQLDARFHIIPASERLKIPAKEVKKLLLVQPGEEVFVGTPLIEKKQLLGKQEIQSPIDGGLYGVYKGRIVLQEIPDWIELRALMQAKVTRSVPNRGVVLEMFGSLIEAVWASGQEGYGKLRLVSPTPHAALQPEEVTSDWQSLVIVVGQVHHLEVLEELERIGVHGLIVGSISSEISRRAAELSFPTLVTDSFGSQGMSTSIYEMLQESPDISATLLSNKGQKRRPEILIASPPEMVREPTSRAQTLAPGQMVRILRAPYAGQVGQIARLNDRIRFTAIETRARGADVTLPDGQTVFVPYANLELFIS